MGWQFRTANFAERFGGRSVRMCPCYGVANNSFRAGSPVTACRVHESFPGEKHMGDGHPPVSGTGASAVKFLSIRSGRPARSAAGTVVRALGQGVTPPSRPSRLHEPAHRPSGLVATPPAFQGFVDPSITGGFVRSSREEDTSQKWRVPLRRFAGCLTYPCCAKV